MTDPTPAVLDGLAEADAIRARARSVLDEALYWFPVRHHSPTVARYVEQAIRERRPKVIFLEAPTEVQHLLPHVVDGGTKPPVALYTSFRDDDNRLGLAGIASEAEDIPPKFPSWYPLVAYSPEYITLKTAHKLGIPVVCMDLPHYGLLARGEEAVTPKTSDAEAVTRSDFYAALARAGGYRTFTEAWDTLFERDTLDLEAYRTQLALFCAAVRHTTDPARIAADDTLPRERHMWRTIQRTLADRGLSEADGMVVCGGFHLFLDRDDPTDPPSLPEGTVHTTLVPFSWFRISEQSGYGAGNRAPGFYDQLHTDRKAGRPAFETIARHTVAVLARARREGEHLAAADTISVVHHAHLLAQLRGRPEPVLDDLHDALITCCIKGDPTVDGIGLRKAMAHVDVGTRLGRVSSEVGQLPLVEDYYGELSRLELAGLLDHEAYTPLTLDKRDPRDAERSAFLNRVRYLGVPIGEVKRTGDVFGQSIFKERWALRWSPKIDDALIERTLDGDTVAAAALHRLTANLAKAHHDAGACCTELLAAVDMDLSAMVLHAEQAAGEAIDEDGRFGSLATAVQALAVLDRYAAYRALSRVHLDALLERAYDRACFALPEAVGTPDEEHETLFAGLRVLGELVLQRDSLDPERFASNCRSAASLCTIPRLRGAFLGIAVEIKQAPPSILADALRAHADGLPEARIAMGDFLDGVLAVSKLAVLLGARDLVAILDEVLASVDAETFLQMAPRLRTAFARLHDRQRAALADQVAQRHGLRAEAVTETLSISAGAAALVAELDAQTARILDSWAFG